MRLRGRTACGGLVKVPVPGPQPARGSNRMDTGPSENPSHPQQQVAEGTPGLGASETPSARGSTSQ